MIFVTVGTHEQQFDRLVRCVDRLKAEGKITEEVMIQTGFSSYEPKACRWSKLCSYQEMNEYMDQARIVITHGGPSSIMMALQRGKIPIVVPRQKQYEEHVNDHQVEFSRFIEEKQKNIIVVEEIDTLEKVITSYEKTAAALGQKQSSNNQRFNEKFEAIVDKLFEGKEDEKAGILSMQRIYNYGSFLQAYALKKMMEECGAEVEFVDYHPGECILPSKETTGMKRKIQKGLEILRMKGRLRDKNPVCEI